MRRVGVGRVRARLDDGSERHVRDLGRVARFREGTRGSGELAANSLHVAAALEIALGGGVGFGPARKHRRREQLGIGCACPRERAIGFDEQRRTQILLGWRLCGKHGEQAGQYDEPSEGH